MRGMVIATVSGEADGDDGSRQHYEGWPGHDDGPADASVLDPRRNVGGAEGRWRSHAAAAARREARRISRHGRPRGNHGSPLSAPLRLFISRAQRSRWASLYLSWLEVRRG